MEKDYNEYKIFFEKHLLDFIPSVDNKAITLYDSMKYSLTAGGKRLRPVLLLAACEFSGGNINEALPYACAMEYIHTYSLIHDDLPAMDNDDLRRGVPTNHKVFGEAMAILAGDGLLTSAFEVISKDLMLYFDSPEKMNKRASALYEIAKGAGVRGMVAGQACDIEGESIKYSSEMLDFLHLNKTGALIKAAIKAGLYLGNPTKEMLYDFENYAEYLGLAFQIRDDILDEVGDEKVLGKAVKKDTEHNKNTYVNLNGMDKALDRLDELTNLALASINKYYDNAEFFNNLALEMKVRTK